MTAHMEMKSYKSEAPLRDKKVKADIWRLNMPCISSSKMVGRTLPLTVTAFKPNTNMYIDLRPPETTFTTIFIYVPNPYKLDMFLFVVAYQNQIYGFHKLEQRETCLFPWF